MELKELKSVVGVIGEEQETTITFSRGEKGFKLYTCDNTMITKLNKLLNTEGSAWKIENVHCNADGTPNGYALTCGAKSCLQLKAKKAKVREMTEEEKQALVARLSHTRDNK